MIRFAAVKAPRAVPVEGDVVAVLDGRVLEQLGGQDPVVVVQPVQQAGWNGADVRPFQDREHRSRATDISARPGLGVLRGGKPL